MSFFNIFNSGNVNSLNCGPEDDCRPDEPCSPETSTCFPDYGFDCRPEGSDCNPSDFI